jgi:hypothetical protein
MNLTVGQTRCINNNIGKNVEVELLSERKRLNILGGTIIMGSFRYVMHSAKKPRKSFINEEHAIHANIAAGYYMVDPINIIL